MQYEFILDLIFETQTYLLFWCWTKKLHQFSAEIIIYLNAITRLETNVFMGCPSEPHTIKEAVQRGATVALCRRKWYQYRRIVLFVIQWRGFSLSCTKGCWKECWSLIKFIISDCFKEKIIRILSDVCRDIEDHSKIWKHWGIIIGQTTRHCCLINRNNNQRVYCLFCADR